MTWRTISALLLGGLLSACALSPDYRRPEAPVPAGWPDQPASAEALPDWRDFFGDARLRALIDAALAHNRELRRAELNVAQARALYGVQRSQLWPALNAEAGLSRSRTPAALASGGEAHTASRYEAGLGLSAWELDFFGRVRSLGDAALAEYLATEQAQRAARQGLIAAVARAHLAERLLAEQIALAERSLTTRRDAFELVERRYQAGAASALERAQARSLVESARVALGALRRRHAQARNALGLLTGYAAPELPEAERLGGQGMGEGVPVGLSSVLLQRRPDILAAEQRLMAANANIGAARAAFFPRVTLTAFGGSASAELSALFQSGTGAWSFAPRITLPIFDWGRNRRNLELAELRREIAVVEYEQRIQQAFREVADALDALASLDGEIAAQQALLKAQQRRLSLAERRYEGGIANYLEVLDAQRELFGAEQGMAQLRQLRLLNRVELFAALGGGD
ncbi:efflux transporter outer membrane subunit [Alkalilimnicola sp. S0819]|uniref:efflux transporter outer membrane subunit n=1 Tax=Alkalilimnicola sp. S0819 TaxID=2613922 RepID=UPI00126174B4|nr:efflux transporter outer membrane subunit [Alkalilimnicola sp. S0819]KAB7627168.1 efflux transporter outer membrane subunit [Alkalilimnicola sp. S0819]MPQ15879.1 efflux transporter outer membrane subunit [Alkalilimnicola sp. S0819]